LLVGYVLKASGVLLGPESTPLLETRLAPLMENAGLRTGHDLLRALRAPGSRALHHELMDCVTTHETSFFRDHGPFEALEQQVLPELARRLRASRPVCVWCAACSTGQEPYSLAMLVAENARRLGGLRAEIVATDLSPAALARGRSGVYSQLEVNRGVSPKRLAEHFEPDGRHWRLSREVRDMVMFSRNNLASHAPPPGRFDLILCRNVMIYLALDVRARVFESLHKALDPEGYLFLGAAESPSGIDDRFRHLGSREHCCYRRTDGGAAARAA
jgi:chemotaxis protein methyltransferase CheR